MLKRWLWTCLICLSLSGCGSGTHHGFGADGQPDPEAEDRSAKYNQATHELSTRNGEYKIYFPDRPGMIPGQKITYQSRMGTGGGWSMVHNFAKERRANFEWVGRDLKLTAIYWTAVLPSMDAARIPGAGGAGSMALAHTSRIGWRMAAQNRLSAFEATGTNDDLTNKVQDVISKLTMTESSGNPIRSPEGYPGREATAVNAAGTDALKMRIYFNTKNRRFYMLLAEGTKAAVAGNDTQKFFDSFTFVPPKDLTKKELNEMINNPEYESGQRKIANFWNMIYKQKEQRHSGNLCEAIKQHGVDSAEVQQEINRTFEKPSTQTMNLTQYAETMQDQLGSDYQVVGKGIGEHAVFGESEKLGRVLDVSSTAPGGSAIAIFLKEDGSLLKSDVHPSYVTLIDKLCSAIMNSGLGSNEVVQSLYQSFAVPIPGVVKDILMDDLREKLGAKFDAGNLGSSGFGKQGSTQPKDSSCIMIQEKNPKKELQILLNFKGQFSDYYVQ